MLQINHPKKEGELPIQIVMAPNRSASWDQNKRVLWALGTVCIGIAVAFTVVAGTWVMLPFAGLEVITLGSALYYVSWKLSYRHIVTIDQATVMLEKGVYRPRGSWIFQKAKTHLELAATDQRRAEEKLTLVCGHNRISIGSFLDPRETSQLVATLEQQIQCRRTFRVDK